MAGDKTTIRITDNNLEVNKIELSLENVGQFENCMISNARENSLLRDARVYMQSLILSRDSEFYESLIDISSEITEQVKEITNYSHRFKEKREELYNFYNIVNNSEANLRQINNSYRVISRSITGKSESTAHIQPEKPEPELPSIQNVSKGIAILFFLTLLQGMGRNSFIGVSL